MKQLIKNITIQIYKVLTYLIPVNKKMIIFQSSNGRNYTGNPRYIYEEMVREGLDQEYECIWFFFDTSIEVPGKCKKIRNNYFPYFWYLMRAGIWVFDSRQPLYVRKKKHITYIQTWHGTPLKKLALDMDRMDMGGSTDIENYHEQFRVTCKDWDYLVSQNKFSTDIFRSCFAFKDRPILQIGYPRNDILINDNSPAKIREYKEKLGLPLDKKIILYAPTWRDNEYSEKGKYKFASKLDFDKAKEELSDEYEFIKIMGELAKKKKEYEEVGEALAAVKQRGYGVVTPTKEEIVLEEPQIVKHGSKYGVKIKASAPSIHMIRANISTEIAPIVGEEYQAKDLMDYIEQGSNQPGESMWDVNIFGKTLEQLVGDGMQTKALKMTDESQQKLQDTMEKIINESNGGLVCIII